MSSRCAICDSLATRFCGCQSPPVFLCEMHFFEHLEDDTKEHNSQSCFVFNENQLSILSEAPSIIDRLVKEQCRRFQDSRTQTIQNLQHSLSSYLQCRSKDIDILDARRKKAKKTLKITLNKQTVPNIDWKLSFVLVRLALSNNFCREKLQEALNAYMKGETTGENKSTKCSGCEFPAEYYCSCTNPITYICRECFTEHMNVLKIPHNIHKYYKIPKLSICEDMMAFISSIFDNAAGKVRREMREFIAVMKSSIEENLGQHSKKLTTIRDKAATAKKVVNLIVESKTITCTGEVLAIQLQKLYEQKVLTKDKITLILKCFILDNLYPTEFSKNSLSVHIVKNEARAITNEFSDVMEEYIFKHPQIVDTARCIHDSCKLIVTGGLVSPFGALEIDIKTSEYRELPAMKHKRFNHAMTWINSCPAVVSGSTSKHKLTSSVEIFQNGKWVSVKPLNFMRYKHTCCSMNGLAFVFGGIDKRNLKQDSIEMYSANSWTVLGLKLPYRATGLGALPLDNEKILILGGNDENLKYRDKVCLIDTRNMTISDKQSISVPSTFLFNSWVEQGEEFTGFNVHGSFTSFRKESFI